MPYRAIFGAFAWVGLCMGLLLGTLTVWSGHGPWVGVLVITALFIGFAEFLAVVIAGALWIASRLDTEVQ